MSGFFRNVNACLIKNKTNIGFNFIWYLDLATIVQYVLLFHLFRTLKERSEGMVSKWIKSYFFLLQCSDLVFVWNREWHGIQLRWLGPVALTWTFLKLHAANYTCVNGIIRSVKSTWYELSEVGLHCNIRPSKFF